MIKMTMQHGEEIQQRDLPCDFLSLKVSLYQMNIMLDPSEVSVQDVQAEFISEDPLGKKLIGLIRPGDTLADVDAAVHQIEAAPQPIQSALGQMLMDGRFETIADIQSNRDRLLEELCGARQCYFFPLSCSMEDEDGELYESDAGALVPYSEQIQNAIEQDQARDIDTMAMYFWCTDSKTSEDIKSKLLTIRWGVEEIRGQLYGRVEVTSTAPLTAQEDTAMNEWISGQNSDGLGEGFEQRPIETDYGDIYVHFWSAGNDYFILNADQFEQYLDPQISNQPQSGHPTLYGLGAGECAELHSVKEVAQFIYEKGLTGDVLITTEDGSPFITTYGIFIDKVADMDYREELLKELVPLQMGEQNGGMGSMSM